jgi:hypothetical protein
MGCCGSMVGVMARYRECGGSVRGCGGSVGYGYRMTTSLMRPSCLASAGTINSGRLATSGLPASLADIGFSALNNIF